MINATQLNSNAATASNITPNNAQSMGKEEFLKLLVAQLQNQNPLSPLEGQEFAAQLAQFSSVEQLTSINDNIQNGTDADLTLTQAVNNTLSANFIGREITSLGNTVTLVSGETPSVNFVLNDYADKVTVKIYDEADNLVGTIESTGMDAGINSLVWDGKDAQGNPLPGGNYHFKVEATDADDNPVKVNELTKGIVSSVRYMDGRAVLIVNGKEISLSDVLEIG